MLMFLHKNFYYSVPPSAARHELFYLASGKACYVFKDKFYFDDKPWVVFIRSTVVFSRFDTLLFTIRIITITMHFFLNN